MNAHTIDFKGEYLWEFEIAEKQLTALAEAFPADRYGWRPAETARSVSEALVHVAAGNLALLGIAGIEAAPDLYGTLEPEMLPRMKAMLAVNERLAKATTDKIAVVALLKRSLDASRAAFTETSEAALGRVDTFFGEPATIRRVYLRMLAHMHEHMGQLIAYTRAMGLRAPWPDWREASKKKMEAGAG